MRGVRTVCSYPGCAARVRLPDRRCAQHQAVTVDAKRARDRSHDVKRRAGDWWRGWYKRSVWLKLRAAHLAREPLCRSCAARGLVVIAKIVDHVTPHRGDGKLFVDPENLQSLCAHCHNSAKQAEERSGDLFTHADASAATGGRQKVGDQEGRGPARALKILRASEKQGGSD